LFFVFLFFCFLFFVFLFLFAFFCVDLLCCLSAVALWLLRRRRNKERKRHAQNDGSARAPPAARPPALAPSLFVFQTSSPPLSLTAFPPPLHPTPEHRNNHAHKQNRTVVDPAHVNFTHSGVQGNRKAEKGTRLELCDRPSPSGFSFRQDIKRAGLPPGARAPRVDVRFTAPCLVRYDFPFVGRSMIVYVVPTGVGRSRMLARFLRLGGAGSGGKGGGGGGSKAGVSSYVATVGSDGGGVGKLAANSAAAAGPSDKPGAGAGAAGGAARPAQAAAAAAAAASDAAAASAAPSPPPAAAKPPLMRRLLFAVLGAVEAHPVLEHALVRNRVLDGDNHLIHVQERILAARAERPEALSLLARAGAASGASAGEPGLKSWRRQYWMPGQSDVGVQAWRSWLQGPGRALPTFPRTAADLGPVVSREEALSRFKQHTAICRHCRDALASIDGRWLPGLAALAAALGAAAMWVAGVRAAAALAAAAAAAAAGGGGAGAGATWGAAVGAAAQEPVAWALAAAAVLAFMARRAVAWFRQQLIFVDYVHADKN